MGSRGMPRRYFDYLPRYEIFHQISTIGSYIMALGFLVAAYCLAMSLVRGKLAPANPWGGNSLEWHTTSPPPLHNFEGEPRADDPYDYGDWEWDQSAEGFVRKDAEATA